MSSSMADDGGNAVATMRFDAHQCNSQILLDGYEIDSRNNGESEPSQLSCNSCDQTFPDLVSLESHERLCAGHQIDSMRTQRSTSINRRSKAPPRKLNLEARIRYEQIEDDDTVITEMYNNISPTSSSDQQHVIDQDLEDVDEEVDASDLPEDAELALAISQEQLDPNAPSGVDEPCYCDICHKAFSGIFALKAHNYYYHSNVRRIYSCKLCPRQFKWEAILKRHVNIVHGRREKRQHPPDSPDDTIRDQAATIGETRDELNANIELTGSGDSYKCNTCDKIFGSLSAVRLHRFSAHGVGPRQVCKYCNKSFRPCHFARHCCWETKSGKRKHAQNIDEVVKPASGSHIDRPQNGTSFWKCVLCQSEFLEPNELSDHIIRIHQVNQRDKLEEFMASGNEEYFEANGQDFVHDQVNEDWEEGDEGSLSLASGSLASGDQQAECPTCHKIFKNRASLGMHRWRHHSDEKRFCSGCRKSYLASQFANHRCCGTGTGNGFSASDNEFYSETGVGSASTTNTVPCANLSSSSSSSLILVGSPPNATASSLLQSKCDMCNRQYANDHSLKDHMRVVHGVYQRITKKQTTIDEAAELHSDNGAPSSIAAAARPSSSTSGAVAHGTNTSSGLSSSNNNNNGDTATALQNSNNNNTSPLPEDGDQWTVASLPLRHRQTTPIAAAVSANSPPTSSTDVVALQSNDAVGQVVLSGGEHECATCHRTFKNSSALRLHRFSAHGACPRRMCSKCNKSFLPWHYLRHACTGLGGNGTGGEPINNEQKIDTKMINGSVSPSGDASYVGKMKEDRSNASSIEWRCTLCERRYLSRRTLKDHLRVVHGVYHRQNLESTLPSRLVPSVPKTATQAFSDSSEGSFSGVLDLSCPTEAKRMRVVDPDSTLITKDMSGASDDGSDHVLNLSNTVGLKSFRCGICYKIFRDIATLRKHRYAAHGACPKKMCPRCKKFLLPWHVKRHVCVNVNIVGSLSGHNLPQNERRPEGPQPNAEDPNLPRCHLCNRSYANEHSLKCHLRVIHGFSGEEGNPTTEGQNGEAPSTGDNNVPSTPEKRGKMPLNLIGNECGVCHKVFQSHGAARLHLFSAHGACPKRLCTTCNKWYLPWHYSRHFCQNGSAQQSGKQRNNVIATSSEEPIDGMGEAPWKCDQCDKAYQSHRTLKDHLRIAHGVYQTIKRPGSAAGGDSPSPTSSPLMSSPSRGEHAPAPSSALKVAPSTPGSTEPKPNPGITMIGDPASPMFECDICAKQFKSSSAARLHRLSGHGACPKKTCPNCNRTFLPCHFARHSCTGTLKEGSHAIQTAPATVALVSGSSASSGLEWRCHLCDRRYQSSRTLKDHLRIGHGVYQTRKPGETDLNEVISRPRGSSLSPGNLITSDELKMEEEAPPSELQQLLDSNMGGMPDNLADQMIIDSSEIQEASNPNNECDICHKMFKNSSALRLHRYVTHVSRQKQLCTRCNKSFLPCHFPRHCCWSTENGEQPPKRTFAKPSPIHSPEKAGTVPTSQQQDYLASCEFCPNTFGSESLLRTHLELEHGIFDSAGEEALIKDGPKEEAVDDDLNDDMAYDEGNEDIEIDTNTAGLSNGNPSGSSTATGFKCGICHMPFSNLTDVRKHRYSVHGACPKRICPKCNKAILPCHFSRHACDPVNSTSVSQQSLPETHPVEALSAEGSAAAFEWKCDLCDRRYLCRRTLNDHRRIVHGVYQRKPVNGEKSSATSDQQYEMYDSDEQADVQSGEMMENEIQEETVKSELREPPPAHSGSSRSMMMVFPGHDSFYDDFLAFKQPVDGEEDDVRFGDPLAMTESAPVGAMDEGVVVDEAISGENSNLTELCTICNKTFKSSSALRLHRFSAHGTCPKKECPKCNKSFLPWHFTRHCCWNKDDEQKESPQEGANQSEAAEGMATCELCRRTYTSARTLKEHMRTVHGVYQRRNQSLATMVPQQQPNVAIERPPSTGSSSVTAATPSTAAGEDTDQAASSKYVCHDCNASFSAPVDLLLHRLSHTGDKPFACADCREAFSMPQELDAHRNAIHPK